MPYPDFYVVSATVIPVFFLALTLQSKQFDDVEQLMRKFNETIKEYLDQTAQEILEQGFSRAFSKFALALVAFSLIRGALMILLLFSVLGEVFAILALYQGNANPGTQSIVLIAVLGLTIGVGLLFFGRLERLWGKQMFILIRWYVRSISLLVRMIRTREDENPHQQDPRDRHAGD